VTTLELEKILKELRTVFNSSTNSVTKNLHIILRGHGLKIPITDFVINQTVITFPINLIKHVSKRNSTIKNFENPWILS